MGIHLLLEGTAGTLDERQQEILQVCREDTARLDRLMRELLDLSKIESGAVDAAAGADAAGDAPRRRRRTRFDCRSRRAASTSTSMRRPICRTSPWIGARSNA